MKHDNEFLKAARLGFQQIRERIDAQISEIDAELNGSVRQVLTKLKRRNVRDVKRSAFSAETRKRMAESQKRRWEAYRKAKAAAA